MCWLVWMDNSEMVIGIKIPPFILGSEGGWQGNLRANLNLSSAADPVMTNFPTYTNGK